MTSIHTAALETPDGVFTVLTDDSAVLASGWTQDAAELMRLIHPNLRSDLREEPVRGADDQGPQVLLDALAAVTSYYDGDHQSVAAVPVQQRSGPFRQGAWEALRRVPPGATVTYTEYAARSGSPGAARAAAGACAQNAAALFVPCHRVVRTDGSLGGFRYGLDVKQSLLRREGAA
ncbi:MAG: methylated-DNA--[protein]-cysteine S-methyltransferase [Nesterenkonia sp.]